MLLREGRGKGKRALGVGDSVRSEGGNSVSPHQGEISPSGTGDPCSVACGPTLSCTLTPWGQHSGSGVAKQESWGSPAGWGPGWGCSGPPMSPTHRHTHTLRAVPELKQSWVLARRPHWLLPASSPLLPLLPSAKGVSSQHPPPSVEEAEPPSKSWDSPSSTSPPRTADPRTWPF